jgi:hypothetical protein
MWGDVDDAVCAYAIDAIQYLGQHSKLPEVVNMLKSSGKSQTALLTAINQHLQSFNQENNPQLLRLLYWARTLR